MASDKPTDELLAALPEVGLQLWMLCDNGPGGWYCVIHGRGSVPRDNDPNSGWGNGETPAAALIEALGRCGIQVTDDSA